MILALGLRVIDFQGYKAWSITVLRARRDDRVVGVWVGSGLVFI